jgi:hypothetical protein
MALDVAGKDLEAHLGSNVLQCASFEVTGPHPVVDGANDVLDRAAPGPHGARHPAKTAL